MGTDHNGTQARHGCAYRGPVWCSIALTAMLGFVVLGTVGAHAQDSGSNVPDSLYRDSSPGVFEPEEKKKKKKSVNTFKGYNQADPNAVPNFPARDPEPEAGGDLQGAMIDPSATAGCAEDEDEKSCAKKAGSLTGLSKEEKKLLNGMIGDVFGGTLGGISGGKKTQEGNKAQIQLDNLELAEQALFLYSDVMFVESIQGAGGFYPVDEVQFAIQAFVEPIFSAARMQNFPWAVVVPAQTGVFNAFALGAGKLAVFPEMIRYMDHPFELMETVAHEVGHVDLGHTSSSMIDDINTEISKEDFDQNKIKALKAWIRKYEGKSFFEKLDMGIDMPPYLHFKTDAVVRAFGREEELQADSNVVPVFSRFGIDMRYAAVAYAKVLLYELDIGAGVATSPRGSTHPITIDRLDWMYGHATNQTRKRGNSKVNWPGWATLKKYFPTPEGYKTSFDANGVPYVRGLSVPTIIQRYKKLQHDKKVKEHIVETAQ